MIEAEVAALSDGLETVAAAAAHGVVRVRGGGRGESGIVWGEGIVVTAEETLGQDEAIGITLPDGSEAVAELIGRDPSTDVAALRVTGLASAGWETAAPPRLGALVLAAGRGPEGPRVALGIVATAGGTWTSLAGGRIDALTRLGLLLPPALEGAAAVDMRGRLLGMTVAGPRQRGLVIPAATIDRSVARLTERGYVARGYLGLALRPVSAGLLVIEVVDGGPAAAAGFVIGDVVTTWNGEPVRRMRDLARRLGADTAGERVEIGLLHGGQPAVLNATIGERLPAGD